MVSNGINLPQGVPTRVVYGIADRNITIAFQTGKPNDFFEVMCHGNWHLNENGIRFVAATPILAAGEEKRPVLAADLAAFILAQPGFVGQTVRLAMCRVGTDVEYVGEVADILGVHVIAATRRLEGNPAFADFRHFDNQGRWVNVSPKVCKADQHRAAACKRFG